MIFDLEVTKGVNEPDMATLQFSDPLTGEERIIGPFFLGEMLQLSNVIRIKLGRLINDNRG